MRYVIHKDSYLGHPLNNSDKNDEGFYVEILHRIETLFDCMIKRRSSVFFTMFDLNFPADPSLSYPNDNGLISRFIEALTLHYKRLKYDPKYLWVRECPSSDRFHYHVMLLLDSNRTQNAHGILDKATELWQRCLGIDNGEGLVHLCKPDKHNINVYRDGVKIRRNATNFRQVYDECYQHASYLAKCYSKGSAPDYVNEFGCSRLPY